MSLSINIIDSKRNGQSDPIDFNREDWSLVFALPVWCLSDCTGSNWASSCAKPKRCWNIFSHCFYGLSFCTVFDVLIFSKTHISDIMMGFNFIQEILGNYTTDRWLWVHRQHFFSNFFFFKYNYVFKSCIMDSFRDFVIGRDRQAMQNKILQVTA